MHRQVGHQHLLEHTQSSCVLARCCNELKVVLLCFKSNRAIAASGSGNSIVVSGALDQEWTNFSHDGPNLKEI